LYKDYNDLYDTTFQLLVDWFINKLIDENITTGSMMHQLGALYQNKVTNPFIDIETQLDYFFKNLKSQL